MKQFIFFTMMITFLASCGGAFEKEIGEVEGLNKIVLETEKTVLSFDTADIFSVKRQLTNDIQIFEGVRDTLDRQTAFALNDYYLGKKRLYKFVNNYDNFLKEIEFSKTQLENLKEDLNNSKITKEQFMEYYQLEQTEVMKLSSEVNEAVSGLEGTVEKMKDNRENVKGLLDSLQAIQ